MQEQSSTRCSVLVVDDDATLRHLLSYYLGKRFDVHTASSGAQALNIALEQQPDLILADVVLPGLDGYELLVRLREEKATQHIPFVFVTGRCDEGSRRKGLALGASDYITKPFDLSWLRRRVQELVSYCASQAAA